MDSPMNKSDIKKNFKICNQQTSKDCIITAPDSSLWTGRCCGNCYAIVRAAVYQANKKVINDKVTAKRRIKRAELKNAQ